MLWGESSLSSLCCKRRTCDRGGGGVLRQRVRLFCAHRHTQRLSRIMVSMRRLGEAALFDRFVHGRRRQTAACAFQAPSAGLPQRSHWACMREGLHDTGTRRVCR